MAIVYDATLTPTKQELVEGWLGSRPWAAGLRIAKKLGEYRFDDPAGEVGVETILWRTDDGTVVQTPLTYRGAPLDGAEEHLVGTTEHSVLGPRWVYDGCADPVWASTLATAIRTGGTQVEMQVEADGAWHTLPPRFPVRGSGTPEAGRVDVTAVDSVVDEGETTVSRAAGVELRLARLLGPPPAGEETLTGELDGSPVVLATLRRTS
jgi:hypothetical protein